MARGWESKAVEEQQNQSVQQTISQEDRDRLARVKADTMRKIQAINLNRARIREQLERSSSDRYKEMLQRELEHLDRELADLEK